MPGGIVVPVEAPCQPSPIPHQPTDDKEVGREDEELIQEKTEGAQAVSRRRMAIFHKMGYGADFACFDCFPRDHWFRSRVIHFVSHRFFDRFIVLTIILNSVILALSDFSVVDVNLNPARSGFSYRNGRVVPATSVLNSIVSFSEIPFTSIFTVECLLKIFALGFFRNKGSYLREPWNVLDFVVVISSLVAILPTVPNVSVIRTIRVLRPLRSLSMISGMRLLISSLLKALPALGNVVVLQVFLFFMFAILGNQLFGGTMTRLCRLTAYPVRLPVNESSPHGIWPVPTDYLAAVLADPEAYRCLDGPLLETDSGNFVKETSPWNEAQPCFWPVDTNDLRICARPSYSGNYQCSSGETCGGNYDVYGNPRFLSKIVMEDALFNDALDYGFTTFDAIGYSAVTFFEVITCEGWTNIMYMCMDSSQPVIAAVFFVAFVVFDSIFVMNLTLAVIADEFDIDASVPQLPAAEKKLLEVKENSRFKPCLPWLYRIASHPRFSTFVMAVIFANTAVLSLDHYPMSDAMVADLEILNFALSCVFVVEMVVKIFGLGLRLYTQDRFNLFDAFVVVMGLLEMALSPPSFMSKNQPKKGALSSLRSFRLLRVFKLARNWRSLRELLGMVGRAIASIANFGVLLFIFIYIYALIGMQFYGNTMRFDSNGYATPYNIDEFWAGEVPRFNYDSFLWSLITVFKIITADNWNENIYDLIRGNHMYDALYAISLIVFGNFIMMNLFLALLLDKFSSNDDEKTESKEAATRKLAHDEKSMKIVPVSGPIVAKKHTSPNELDKFQQSARTLYQRHHHAHLDELAEHPEDVSQATSAARVAPELVVKSESARVTPVPTPRMFEPKVHDESTAMNEGPTAGFVHEVRGNSLFVFSGKSRVRRWALDVIAHPYFDSVVLALVAASSITLAIDNPLQDPQSALASALKRIDTAFAFIFACEMTVKIIALGLVLHQGAYLRDGWNVLDCVVVVSSLVTLAESLTSRHSTNSLPSLRTFRAFRPLRMVSRRPGLKLVVNALIEAIPAVLNVLIVCALFYLMFSIFAVTYLKGQLKSCSGAAFDALSDAQVALLVSPQPWSALSLQQQQWFANTSCIGFPTDSLTSRYLCGCWGGDWTAVVLRNFDNVGNAMITFFEISTTENWSLLMLACIDATEIDMQPIRDYNMWWAAFFVLFMMFGSFFMVNLFIGVIIDNFNKMTDAHGDAFMLTDEQKKWIRAQKAATQVGPQLILKPFKDPTRRAIFFFVRNSRFEWFIMGCIIVSTLLMAAQHYGQSTAQTTIVAVFDDVFATIFTIEAALKIAAYGVAYFQDNWNRFDLFVVTGTLISIVLEALTTTRLQSLAMLVRIFRVTRIVRLVKASKGIRHILTTLYLALPGLTNVSSILFLLLFIYTTMGVQMFAKVGLNDNIDVHANFQSFGTGFLFMIRSATGESWDDCMHDFVASPEGCVDDPVYDPTMCGFNNSADCIPLNGCGNPIAYLFFCSFTLLGTYVMINVTVAVILDSFSVSNEDDEPLFEPELLSEFQTKWAQVDPKAEGFIPVTKLRAVFSILEPPLVKENTMLNKNTFLRFVRDLRLPMYDGDTVHFTDTLVAMTREMVQEDIEDELNLLGNTSDRPHRYRLDYQAHEYFAVSRIQHAVVAWVRLKRQLEKKYIEEYTLKLKKISANSAHSKRQKQRGARVITTG